VQSVSSFARGDSTAWQGAGFGLAVSSDQPLLPPSRSPPGGEPLELRRVDAHALASAWRESPGESLWRTKFPDGAIVSVEQGSEGEQRIAYGELAAFQIAADGHELRWAQTSNDDAAVQRFLLDTCLWWTSMTLGFELLHASAVRLANGELVAIAGPTGAGKTSLAIELIRQGATPFADDVLAIRREDSRVVSHPGPALMNVPDAARTAVQDWTTPIASFPGQGETWMAVDRAAAKPASLSAAIVLDRGPKNALEMLRLQPSPLTFMGYTWGLTNTGARGESSFETFADLAESAPAYHLNAPADASPEVIAKLIINTCG